MAEALFELGHTADAVTHLAEAERLDPENKIPHYLLASAYRSLGDSDQAAKEFAAYKRLGASDRSPCHRAHNFRPAIEEE